MTIKITNRRTGKTIFEAEADNLRDAVVLAVKAGASLRGADLSRADLSWAGLSGANLSEADLTGADLSGAKLNKLEHDGDE